MKYLIILLIIYWLSYAILTRTHLQISLNEQDNGCKTKVYTMLTMTTTVTNKRNGYEYFNTQYTVVINVILTWLLLYSQVIGRKLMLFLTTFAEFRRVDGVLSDTLKKL